MRSKAIWLIASVLAIAALSAALLWRVEPAQIITLSDGRQYRFAGVTWGTNHHQPGPMLARFMDHFPTNWVNPIRKKLGPRFGFVPPVPSPIPTLLLWLEPLGTNAPVRSGWLSGAFILSSGLPRSDLAGNLADETGVPSGLASGEEFYGLPEWPHLGFSQVPRRSPILECDLWQAIPGSDGSAAPKELFKIRFRNPACGHYPQWQPETLPATKSADDLRVTIGPLAATAFGYQGVFGAWQTKFPLSLESSRKAYEAWEAEVELSDATGNLIRPIHNMNDYSPWWPVRAGSQGPFGFSMDYALWPGESAWRLKLFLKRSAGLPDADLVTFSNLPISHVPGSPNLGGNMVVLSNYQNDLPVVIRIGTSTNTSTTYPDKVVRRQTIWAVYLDNLNTPAGIAMDVVALTADTGEKASSNFGGNYWQFPSQAGPDSEPVPQNFQSVSVTVAVQKIRTVEFLVKPPAMRIK